MKYKTTESKPMSWYNDFTFTVEGRYISPFEIEKVIVNYPAVIILWRDKTKTVVKCQENDNWDIEKAIAMCFVKKALGNEGNYYNHIRDALKKCEGEEAYGKSDDTLGSLINDVLHKAIKNLKLKPNYSEFQEEENK